ncbi:YeeE/YedE family protein [Pedobacter sandarakinus]|uniref:YeeE/YedE family protein n=1 Tax=Pedobacter sandarakinus TaxID=353156 RepID=UPI00224500BB|nr:YeeE/YedE thiosulfate transporter family protein [Pedobacter sandarakinus]MCX2575182.1 YeeE/YedE thiosulfate transporter family protein [Pedobacter sandarakinus]
MIEFIKQPWPWYFSGFMIIAVMLVLIFFGKSFGFSSNLRTMCSMAGAGKRVKFFDFEWKNQIWNLMFLVGSILGGFIATNYLSTPSPLKLSPETIKDLDQLGVRFDGGLNPSSLFSLAAMKDIKTIAILLIGGLLVGFGSRYAGGCTSGHAISGLSNLQIPSLVAVIGFFIGGLIMTFFIIPLIF